jgi:WD40 repeat protein
VIFTIPFGKSISMKGTLFTLLLFFVSFVQGQDMRDHWILSDSIHLQFTDTGVVFLGFVPFQSEESIATISDLDGHLLLFANESRVYDKYYNIIENGDSLFGSIYATTSTQGAVLLPNDGNYFIINRSYNDQPNGLLSYSIIKFDSLLNNYYIPSLSKKIVVQGEQFAEQLQAVRHGNGLDWWIIGRKLINAYQPVSNAFVVYKLSGEDFTLEHEIEIGQEAHFQGELSVSPDGSLVALASLSIGVLQLFSFDRCTGVVSNPRVLIDDPSATYYGCAFSPDGTRSYLKNRQCARVC